LITLPLLFVFKKKSPKLPVLLDQLPAILFAMFVIAGLSGLASSASRIFARKSTPAMFDFIGYFYAVLFVMCAALTLRTWVSNIFIEWTCLIMLGCGFLIAVGKFWSEIPSFIKPLPKPVRWLLLGILTVLSLDLLYASLPLYRYDQWTYHLVIAKWISKLGHLNPPVTYDHIFFTGSYEFLGLLARAISASDTFQQGFQNSLTWFLVVITAFIIFQAGRPRSGLLTNTSLAFSMLILFGTGDHEALINTKPDYILMMVGFLLIAFMIGGQGILSPGLAGFLLSAGLSFKITWLHFVTCAPFLIWGSLRGEFKKNFTKFLIGGLLALPCHGPWAIKNLQFFGNPLHPAQTSLFKSSLWGPELADYWQAIMHRPENIKAFISNFFEILWAIPLRYGSLGVSLFFVGVMLWRTAREKSWQGFPWAAFILSFLTYLLTWGLFFYANIGDRFVACVYIFPIALIWWWSRFLPANNFLALVLMVPFFINGQIEVTIWHLAKAAVRNWPEFAAGETGPLQKISDLMAITDDRKKMFPAAKYNEAILLSDFQFNFYGPSTFWSIAEPITWIQVEREGIDPIKGDGMAFLEKMDIKYVWIVNPKVFAKGPPALQHVISNLDPLPSKIGQLYRVKGPH